MDFNILLNRFGLDSSFFINKSINQIKNEHGFIYEVYEEKREYSCPYCSTSSMRVHTYKWSELKLSSSINCLETLRVRRIRYKCPYCGKTHTFELPGIKRNETISKNIKNDICSEFHTIQSFSTIARRYSVSLQTVINIFDQYTQVMPRKKFPEYLCIDEKHFDDGINSKYCVILSDFFSGEVVDVICNRQMPYLIEYFNSISFKERNNVKVFISDMYDGYSTIQKRFFPNSIFVVDLFHVVKLLTETVNKIRIRTYNQYCEEGTLERHFLKTNWKFFLLDLYKIHKNDYHSEKFSITLPLGEMILRCLKLNISFWDAYDVLQELLHYDLHETYTESERFINRIIAKLNSSGDELLLKVANSYEKWKVGIINGLARNQTGRRFSNGIAESNNSHIQRIINVAYGYKNFKRFRARIMLYLSYKNQK